MGTRLMMRNSMHHLAIFVAIALVGTSTGDNHVIDTLDTMPPPGNAVQVPHEDEASQSKDARIRTLEAELEAAKKEKKQELQAAKKEKQELQAELEAAKKEKQELQARVSKGPST